MFSKISKSLVAATILAAAASAQAQTIFDDFSSGNDNAWTRLDGSGVWLGVPSIYSFPTGAYRIQTPAVPGNVAYLSSAFRQDGASADSRFSIDLVNWNNSLRQNVGLLARTSQFGSSPDRFQTYMCSFTNHGYSNAANAYFSLDRLNDGGMWTSLNYIQFPASTINPLHDYRIEFEIIGRVMHASFIDISVVPSVRMYSLDFVDNSEGYIAQAGMPGVTVFSNTFSPSIGATDITFDNFNFTSLDPVLCPADFNGDSVVDFFDYLDFVAAFSAGDSHADFNIDSVIDFFDYLDFVNAFSSQC